MTTEFTIKPIGYFYSAQTRKYQVPRQGSLSKENQGVIKLCSGLNFEQALEGLEDFERIWVLFKFHLHHHWKPKVLPPRGGQKQGVFATRSPHRPNLIGLSCVELQKISGLNLYIANHDLIDETPIIDIKPYLNYADSFQCQKQGWLDRLKKEESYSIQWSDQVMSQFHYLSQEWNFHLQEKIEHRLETNPLPSPNNRIKQIHNHYQLAYQTWRIHYSIDNLNLNVLFISSGYDQATLNGFKSSRWGDLNIHQAFVQKFK